MMAVQHLTRLLCKSLTAQVCTAVISIRHASSSADIISKWQGVLSSGQTGQSNAPGSTRPLHAREQMRQLVQDAIHVYKSEGAAAVLPDRITDVFMSAYNQLDTQEQQLTFFTLLAKEFGVQGPAVDAAVQLWHHKAHQRAGASSELTYRLADKLVSAAQPLYMQLLLPISQHKTGIAFLVRLRADLLQLLHDQPALSEAAALRALSQDLRAALARWFSVGLVQLERITWENTPGQLLERVMCTEAVHRMQHMEELKRRLQQSDRRVFAFLHPSLPGEPLVVLHTAIMAHVPASMQEVLGPRTTDSSSYVCSSQDHSKLYSSSTGNTSNSVDVASSTSSSSKSCSRLTAASSDDTTNSSRTRPENFTTDEAGTVACFYSISSGQPGLSGVDLGNFLIKKAALLLLSELPQLQHLVTLSPIPGFRAWLITRLQQEIASATASTPTPASSSTSSDSSNTRGSESFTQQAAAQQLLKQHEVDALLAVQHTTLGSCNSSIDSAAAGSTTTTTTAAAASKLLELVTQHSWLDLPADYQANMQLVLQRLCAEYLLKERRRGFALDPVAHFHLKNGAMLWRINTRADLSAAGLNRSCGLMVNYKYVLADVSANNQAYLVDHVIPADPQVKQLLK